MRFSTDFPIAIREIMGRRLKVREYLSSFRGTSAGAVFAKDDIVPAVLEFPLLLLLFIERLVGRRPI